MQFTGTLYLLTSLALAAAAPDPNEILRLGVVRSTESIPLLQPLAQGPDSDDTAHAARLALARMGDEKQLEFLRRELGRKKPLKRRLRALRALGYVGDKSAVRWIVPLLGEKGEVGETAVETLGELLPQTRTRLLLLEPDNPDRAGQWRRWWNGAKDLPPETYDELP